jgi:hypothetical protein
MTEQPLRDDPDLAHAEQRGYEPRDAAPWVGWVAGIGIAVLVAGAMGAMSLLSHWLTEGQGDTTGQSLAAPRTGSEVRLRDIRRAQQHAQLAALNQYRWIDRPANVAQIPIERALELIAADPSLLAGEAAKELPAGDDPNQGTDDE